MMNEEADECHENTRQIIHRKEWDYRSVEQESKKSKLRLVFSQLIIQMAEQNKEKERCSGSYRQAVGFLVIKDERMPVRKRLMPRAVG